MSHALTVNNLEMYAITYAEEGFSLEKTEFDPYFGEYLSQIKR